MLHLGYRFGVDITPPLVGSGHVSDVAAGDAPTPVRRFAWLCAGAVLFFPDTRSAMWGFREAGCEAPPPVTFTLAVRVCPAKVPICAVARAVGRDRDQEARWNLSTQRPRLEPQLVADRGSVGIVVGAMCVGSRRGAAHMRGFDEVAEHRGRAGDESVEARFVLRGQFQRPRLHVATEVAPFEGAVHLVAGALFAGQRRLAVAFFKQVAQRRNRYVLGRIWRGLPRGLGVRGRFDQGANCVQDRGSVRFYVEPKGLGDLKRFGLDLRQE